MNIKTLKWLISIIAGIWLLASIFSFADFYTISHRFDKPVNINLEQSSISVDAGLFSSYNGYFGDTQKSCVDLSLTGLTWCIYKQNGVIRKSDDTIIVLGTLTTSFCGFEYNVPQKIELCIDTMTNK